MIPAKGTTNRRVIDYLRAASVRTRESVYRAMNDIARAAIDIVLENETKKGHINVNKSGIRLTGMAQRMLDEEGKNAQIDLTSNFKPRGVQPSWRDSIKRPGADAFMDWQSRQN